MYQFLYSEVWWVEIVIAAVITGGVTLIGTVALYFNKSRKILESQTRIEAENSKLGAGHADLAREHGTLSKEHGNLSKEHSDISKSIVHLYETTKETKSIATDMRDTIREEKQAQEYRHQNLSKDQQLLAKSVTDSIHSIQALKDAFLAVNAENKSLQEQMKALAEQNEKVVSLNSEIKDENFKLQKNIDALAKEYTAVLAQYNSLLRENDQLQNEQRPPRHNNDPYQDWGMDR